MTYFCSGEEQKILFEMSEAFSVKTKVALEFCLFYKYGLNSKKSIMNSKIKKSTGRCVNFTVEESQFNSLNLEENKREKISNAITETFNHWKSEKMEKNILRSYFPHI